MLQPHSGLHLLPPLAVGFSRASTWHVGPQLGHVEHIVNTCETPLQVKLVCSLAHALEDLERAHKPLMKLMYSRQMQVAGAQQHPVPNLMLLVPVMAVKVPLSGTPTPSTGEPWLSQASSGYARQSLQPQHGYQLGPPHPVVSVAAPQW